MRNKTLMLCLVVCLSLLIGCAGRNGETPKVDPLILVAVVPASSNEARIADDDSAALTLISTNITASEKICVALGEVIDWMANDEEVSTQQMQEKHDELKLTIRDLAKLQDEINALPAGGQDGVKLTIAAAREYFRRLTALANDLSEVVAYGVELFTALEPTVNFNPPESTTGYNDYSLFAGQLSLAVSQSQTLLKKARVPAYLSGSHSDLVKRMDEYQSFCQDFSVAIQLDDPLRIYSCMYRMERLEMMIEKCGNNLDEDLALQFDRLKIRLGGSVASIRGELVSNIALLQG